MSGLTAEALRTRCADLEVEVREPGSDADELRIDVAGGAVWSLLERLRNDEASSARRLVDLTVIDRSPEEPSLEVVYRLYSSEFQTGLRVHAGLAIGTEPCTIESVTTLWSAANWLEREAYDLFGVVFSGHPDLRRLLLEQEFEGAPLRRATEAG